MPDALTKKALSRLGVFTTFLATATGRTGFLGGAITEVGIPQARADSSPPAAYVADVPLWQRLMHEWYRAADDAGLWVTGWSSGQAWNDITNNNYYNLGLHTNSAAYTSSGTNINRFMSPGGIDVVEAHPPQGSAVYRRGVAISGPEAGHKQPGFSNATPGTFGTDYTFPTGPDAAVLASRQQRTVRLAVSWERLQPTLLGALDTTYLGRITTFADACLANGIGLIIELHNYARYEYWDAAASLKRVLVLRVEAGLDTATTGPTGEDTGAIGPDYLIDVWRRLSNVYRTHAGVVGYELMNEPHDVKPTVGSFSGTTLNDWNGGTVQSWTGSGTTVAHTTSTPYEGSGALRVSGTTGTAGVFVAFRAERNSVAGTGNVLRGRIRLNGTPTGTWFGRFEWQTAAFSWQTSNQVTLTPGTWVNVECDFSANPIAGTAINLAVQAHSNNPAGTQAVTFDVDLFERGAITGAYTDVQAWEYITQQVLNELRVRTDGGTNDTKTILVAGMGWNVLSWNHATAWITEPPANPGTHLYVTHHYFDAAANGDGEGEGVYQVTGPAKRYADGTTYAVSQGFTADADATAPTISVGPTVSGITATGATISWTTSEAADRRVEYGVTNSNAPLVYGSSTARATNLLTSHSVALSGLTGGTSYVYRVNSRDAAGNLVTASGSFSTTGAGTVNAPSNLVATAVSTSQINLTWTDNSTDESGFEVEWSANGTSGWTLLATVAAGVQAYSHTGLAPGTRRYYRLRAYRN